ncbi:MAG: hypothetical protein ACRDQF_18610 [Thermocrispum sp.]
MRDVVPPASLAQVSAREVFRLAVPALGAAGLVLFVTLLSLPALRAVVAVKNLRTE